jgi:hypothetical protein
MEIIGHTASLRACKKVAPQVARFHAVRRFQFDGGEANS